VQRAGPRLPVYVYLSIRARGIEESNFPYELLPVRQAHRRSTSDGRSQPSCGSLKRVLEEGGRHPANASAGFATLSSEDEDAGRTRHVHVPFGAGRPWPAFGIGWACAQGALVCKLLPTVRGVSLDNPTQASNRLKCSNASGP